MMKQTYAQPKLELVSLDTTDILLASQGSEPDTVGTLDADYAVALEAVTWGEVWSE